MVKGNINSASQIKCEKVNIKQTKCLHAAVIQVSVGREITVKDAIYTMFLAKMSTVASQVACKHGVDVSQDFT